MPSRSPGGDHARRRAQLAADNAPPTTARWPGTRAPDPRPPGPPAAATAACSPAPPTKTAPPGPAPPAASPTSPPTPTPTPPWPSTSAAAASCQPQAPAPPPPMGSHHRPGRPASRQHLGFVNPAIYHIARGSAYHRAFHDVVTGDNSVLWPTGVFTGDTAGPGWDPVTGWGSPNALYLVPLLAHTARSGA